MATRKRKPPTNEARVLESLARIVVDPDRRGPDVRWLDPSLIARETGLSLGAVRAVLRSLERQGRVETWSYAGTPATAYRLKGPQA